MENEIENRTENRTVAAPGLVAIGMPEEHEGVGPITAGWRVVTYFPTKEDADAFIAILNFN